MLGLRNARSPFPRSPFPRSHYGPSPAMRTQEILSAHPNPSAHLNALVAGIDAAFECAQCCTACADACLAEDEVDQLRRCIRTDRDCADVCDVTGRLLSRQTEPAFGVLRAQVEACLTACRACAEECAQHAPMHEHCRVCAECCRRCEEACTRLLDALPQTTA